MNMSTTKEPTNLITKFIGGSLIVIILCLSVTATIFAFSFLQTEGRRVNIAKQQMLQFFSFQKSLMAEEMWTRNLESIAVRVAGIAKQLGGADYDLYLADEVGTCLYHANQVKKNETCQIPGELKTMIAKPLTNGDVKQTLEFDQALDRNIYLTPLLVGSLLKGYMYVSLSDPYHFYRGDTLHLASKTFLPAIAFVGIIWIIWLLVSKRWILKPYLINILELQKKEAVAHMAQQVAHDLKSPLATLLAVTESLKQIPEERLRLIKNAVSSIRDIANNLLDKKNIGLARAGASNEPKSVELITSLVDKVVSERRAQYRHMKDVQIYFDLSQESYGLFADIQPIEFKRVISNLINNAVEALPGNKGEVNVTAVAQDEAIVISIRDNGAGIPEERLAALGKRGATYGKVNGNGLGLYHGIETVRSWGGKLEISSEVDHGTCVAISLGRSIAPNWFCEGLALHDGMTVVILDDDDSTHRMWDGRLESLIKNDESIAVIHFKNPKELIAWRQSTSDVKNALFLCDYDLGRREMTGLEVIHASKIQEHSTLITGHFDELHIRNSCLEMGVKLVPKDLSGFLSLVRHPQ